MTNGPVVYFVWIWIKGWFMSWVRWNQTMRDFIMLLRTILSFKLTVDFWNFSFNIVRPWLISMCMLSHVQLLCNAMDCSLPDSSVNGILQEIILECIAISSYMDLQLKPQKVKMNMEGGGRLRTRLQCRRPWFNSWVRKIPWRGDRLPTLVFLSFPGGSVLNNLPAMWETWVHPWVGKIPWRRTWQPIPIFLPGESPWTDEPGGR